MSELQQACLLRIYIGESDRYHGRPLYEAIVEAARAKYLAGATVLRGPMGYGSHSQVHTTKILRLSEDLPMVIEIVDERETIEEFLPQLEEMMTGGLITLERIEMKRIAEIKQPEESQ